MRENNKNLNRPEKTPVRPVRSTKSINRTPREFIKNHKKRKVKSDWQLHLYSKRRSRLGKQKHFYKEWKEMGVLGAQGSTKRCPCL